MRLAREAQQPKYTTRRPRKRTETASSRTSAQAADVDSSNGARQCTGALGRPGSSPLTLVSDAAIRGLKYMTVYFDLDALELRADSARADRPPAPTYRGGYVVRRRAEGVRIDFATGSTPM